MRVDHFLWLMLDDGRHWCKEGSHENGLEGGGVWLCKEGKKTRILFMQWMILVRSFDHFLTHWADAQGAIMHHAWVLPKFGMMPSAHGLICDEFHAWDSLQNLSLYVSFTNPRSWRKSCFHGRGCRTDMPFLKVYINYVLPSLATCTGVPC